jgi:hypothetical protein
MKTKKKEVLSQYVLGKLEMTIITGGQPAPSTMNTENVGWTGSWWQVQTTDTHGDSYPDDCCE